MLTVKLDLGGIQLATERLKLKADVLLEHAVADLAAQTHAHVVEQASSKLHSTRQKYIDALSYEQLSPGSWTVTLDNSAMWIEEGMPRHEMIDDLLKNGAQVSKKTGARYRVIPMPVKGKTETPASGQAVRMAAMAALRRAKINMKDIEKEVDGRAKIGTLHKLDETGNPLKTADGAGQGHGAIGHVRQGMTGTPFLKGMRVMQRQVNSAPPVIQRTAMTFRVVSSLMKGTGRWVHPGIKAVNLMDEAQKWAELEWEKRIRPEILDALSNPAGR
jgi:hypothetical protein